MQMSPLRNGLGPQSLYRLQQNAVGALDPVNRLYDQYVSAAKTQTSS